MQCKTTTWASSYTFRRLWGRRIHISPHTTLCLAQLGMTASKVPCWVPVCMQVLQSVWASTSLQLQVWGQRKEAGLSSSEIILGQKSSKCWSQPQQQQHCLQKCLVTCNHSTQEMKAVTTVVQGHPPPVTLGIWSQPKLFEILYKKQNHTLGR